MKSLGYYIKHNTPRQREEFPAIGAGVLALHASHSAVKGRIYYFTSVVAWNLTLVIVPFVVALATRGTVEPTVNVELGAGLTIFTVIPWVSCRCVPPLNNVRRPRMADNTVLTGNFRFGPSGIRKKLKLIWMRLSLPKLTTLFWFIILCAAYAGCVMYFTGLNFVCQCSFSEYVCSAKKLKPIIRSHAKPPALFNQSITLAVRTRSDEQ